MKRIVLASLAFFIPGFLFAQKADYSEIKTKLEYLYDRDQKVRQKGDSAAFMMYVDSTNLVTLEQIIGQIGWPPASKVGKKANSAAWLVVQHAPLESQEKYFPMMEKSVKDKESNPVELAYLDDRIRMRKGQKQLYGTQVKMDEKTGAPAIWPIEDEEHVDKRRAELGLEKMADYAKRFGIDYKKPR